MFLSLILFVAFIVFLIIPNNTLPISYTTVQTLPIITKNILIDATENHASCPRLDTLAAHHDFTRDQSAPANCLHLLNLRFAVNVAVVLTLRPACGTQLLLPGTHPHALFGTDPVCTAHLSLHCTPQLPLPALILAVLERYFTWSHQPLSLPRSQALFDLILGLEKQTVKSPFCDLIIASQSCHLNVSKNERFTSNMIPVSLYEYLVLQRCLTIPAAFIRSLHIMSLSFLNDYNFKTHIVWVVNTFDAVSLLLNIKLSLQMEKH